MMIPLLQGIRIIEVGAVVLGPYAGQLLADLGAEVIKVEPIEGDIARHAHPGGALFVNHNRNKRMPAIDLTAPAGTAALARLLATAAVLLHNIRGHAAELLGMGFAALTAITHATNHSTPPRCGLRGAR